MTDKETPPKVLPLTDGQSAIRVSFNVNQDPDVAEIKNMYAKLIDKISELRVNKLATEGKSPRWVGRTAREFSIAITELESSAHWAVKGLTAHFQD